MASLCSRIAAPMFNLSYPSFPPNTEPDIVLFPPTLALSPEEENDLYKRSTPDCFREFTLFPELPQKLRDMIWDFSLPGPRIVTVTSKARKRCVAQGPIPAMLHVCQNSRKIALKTYTLRWGPLYAETKHPVYFSERDILLFDDQVSLKKFQKFRNLTADGPVHQIIVGASQNLDRHHDEYRWWKYSSSILETILRQTNPSLNHVVLLTEGWCKDGRKGSTEGCLKLVQSEVTFEIDMLKDEMLWGPEKHFSEGDKMKAIK